MPRQKQTNPRGLKQSEEGQDSSKDGSITAAQKDGTQELASNPPVERKPQEKRQHGKNKPKYKSAMKVKITDRVRQKREAKALKEKQNKVLQETLSAQQVEKKSVTEKQPKDIPEPVKEPVKEPVQEVIYKDKYDIIKERRARMSRASQEQQSLSPSKTAKESVQSSPKKQNRQRHTSSGSQKSDASVSVLRNSESEEEGALKQQALEALLEITGKEFKSMNSYVVDQRAVSTLGDAVVAPHTPPALRKKSGPLKKEVEDSPLMQFAKSAQLHEKESLKSTPDSEIKTHSETQQEQQQEQLSVKSTETDAQLKQKQGKHLCMFCGRRCSKPSVLKKHIRSHTGERPYPCAPCGISFKTKSNLYKHCKSHAHAAKAGTSGTDLKPPDFENESGSDETDTDVEGEKDNLEEGREVQSEPSAANQQPSMIRAGQHERLKMTQTSMQTFVNGGHTSVPDNHPTFVPSSKSQASPVASQTGNTLWGVPSNSGHHTTSRNLYEINRSLQQPMDVLNQERQKIPRQSLSEGNTSRYENRTSTTNEGRSDMKYAESASYETPSLAGEPNAQNSSQPPGNNSSSQIMIPLTNFNIVKSRGQYQIQIPMEGIPGLSEEMMKQQGLLIDEEKGPAKEKVEKSRPPNNSPATNIKLQQHIQKLITQNQAIVDDTELESVKPRRPSFSYRESLTSITPQLPAASSPDVRSESKIASESSPVAVETRRRSELAEQTNLDSKQEVRGNHDRQREAQTLKSSQNTAHLHAGQPRHELPFKPAEAGISAGPKLPTSLPVTLHQAVPGDSSTIRNILLQHKLTQQPPSSMLGQSLPMDRQQYSPLWAPSPMMAPWMLKEVLQSGMRYPVSPMYPHPAMMQHLPTDPSQAHQYLRENAPNSQQQHSESGKTAHKRKKSKSESDSSGSHDQHHPHHSRKRMRKHNDRLPVQEEEALKSLQSPNAAHHSTLPMFSPPFPGPDANQAASQLLWMHASLPKGTSTPLRSPYSPKPSVKVPEASYPGVSVIQHTPTTPHAPSQFPVLPPQAPSPFGQELSDKRRDSPASAHHYSRESRSPGSAFHSTGSMRGEFSLGNPPLLHSPAHDGLLKVAPPQSPLTPKTPSIASPMIPGPTTTQSKDEQQKRTPSMEQMPVNEALARKKRSFTLALDENSARASLQKRRNLPAIPGLNMSPGRSVPSKRTPSDQTHALDLTSKIQSMGSPMSAKIPKVEMPGRSPAYTPTEGGKKFPKSPMKFGANAAARHRLSLDLQQPLTAAVKGASTPDGAKPSPKIDPRVLLSPEALSIAESVMRMSNSPMKAKTPSTPVDAARELGRLVAHAFHNAGGRMKSVLTTSDEGVIVGPIATPTAEGKPMSKYFILPSPSSSHAPSFPSSSSPRSEKSPLSPSDSEMKSPIQARPQSAKKDGSGSSAAFEFAKAGEEVEMDGKDKNQNETSEQIISKLDEQSPVVSKPQMDESSDDFTVDDQLMKVLTPVLQEKSPKTMPKKLGKSLADWFKSVKTNRAGNGPLQAPTFLYANISSRMKGVAQVTDCCSRRVQPMYVLQDPKRKISMYSNWKPGGNTKHPLGISWRAHLGLYNSSMNKENIKDVVSSISPAGAGILTHSSAWNMTAEKIKAVSEEMQKPTTSKTSGLSAAGTPTDSEMSSSFQEADSKSEKSVKGKEPKRIPIFEGGFKSNEDYVYVRGRGRGKYVCQECGIRCKKPSMLKKHIRTHTDVRPFQCSVCSFAFKTKGNLTKHMKSKAHTKKCLENGINPSDLEQEHGIDSSAYEDGDHQYSDADDNEDTDSADEDSEEEEMDDGMDEEMEIDDPAGDQDSHSTLLGERISHPARLKRSYSEILKSPTSADMKDDLAQGSKPSRSEVVCKLSQHLSNRQRAHVGHDRTHPLLTKSHSLSHLPTVSEAFSHSILRQKSQPPPVLDKYGHIVSLQSYVPCTNQYRLATGNSVRAVTSEPSQGSDKSIEGDNKDDKDACMSSPTGVLPESRSKKDNDDEKSTVDVSQTEKDVNKQESFSSMTPLDSLNRIRPSRGEETASMPSKSESTEKTPLRRPNSIAIRPHESLMRMRERPESGMRFYMPSSNERLPPKVSPIIESVSDDEDDSESRKAKPSDMSSATAPKTDSSTASSDAQGNAIKQLLLAKPSLWPTPGDKSPMQPYFSPFLPPSPSFHAAPVASPTHLSPFSPGPFSRLVSPMLPSKMFQLPPTILPMHLPSSTGPIKSRLQPEKEKVASPTKEPAEASPMVSPSESHPKEKSPIEPSADESKPSGSEDDRLAMSPTPNHGHHRCSQCGETFIKPSQLRIHARVHTSEGSFTCHDCLVSFPTKYLLSKHERSEDHFLRVEGVELATTTGSDSNPRPFKCKECAIAFRIPGHLAKHLRSKGHLMTLERQGKLPAHKQDLLHMHPESVEEGAGGTGEQKSPSSPTSSEKTDSASEAEEGKS